MATKKRPTERSMDLLRELGITAQVVEKWVTVPNHPGGGVRRDLFGLIDIIALTRGGILGIQTTSASNHSAHVHKALAEPKLAEWLEHGGRFEIWSWKKGKDGKWEVRTEEIAIPES